VETLGFGVVKNVENLLIHINVLTVHSKAHENKFTRCEKVWGKIFA